MTDARRRSLTLILCCLAQFMVVLDVSIVNVALPSISADLGFTPASLAWVVNAYTLAFAGFLLLGGRAADLLGRREVFAGGLALFALASLAGGLAQGELTLVAARAAQGLGGAVVAPATLSILTTGFPEGHERNRALGLWGAMGAIGGASGALLGGVLTETLSWRWILIINVPIGLLGALAALHVVRTPGRDAGATRQFDLAGALSVTLGLRRAHLRDRRVRHARLGVGAHAAHAGRRARRCWRSSCVVEGRLAARPLVPLRIFASRALSAANVVVFCLGGSVFAMWYFVSLYLQQVLGYSPIEAGLAFLPMPLTIAACTQAATRLTGRHGPGPVLAVGMTLIATGMLLFAARRRRRRLRLGRAGAGAAVLGRDRLLVRPGHDRGDHGRAPDRGGTGLRAGQHVAPDGRLGRPRAAGHRRHAAHRRAGAATRRTARGADGGLPPRVRARRGRSRWPGRWSARWCSQAELLDQLEPDLRPRSGTRESRGAGARPGPRRRSRSSRRAGSRRPRSR